MKKRLFAFLLMFIAGSFSVFAQVENPTRWSYSQKSLGNNEYELIFKAAIEPGWHVYSMYTPAGGPMATVLNLQETGKLYALFSISAYPSIFSVPPDGPSQKR